MSLLSSAWIIAKKDLRVYFRDRMSLLLGFLLPIVLVTTFGFIMGQAGGGNGQMPKVALWVSDRDQTETSEAFIDALRGSEMLRILPSTDATESDHATIERKVADGDTSHVLVIEQGFATVIERSEEGALRLIRDPGRTMEDRLINLGIMQAMYSVQGGEYWSTMMGKQFANAGMPEIDLQQFNQTASELSSVIERWASTTDQDIFASEDAGSFGFFGTSTAVANEDVVPPDRPKQVTYRLAQSVSGVSVMMLMFGLASCGVTLLIERDRGTMARLLASPVSRNSILLGKVLFTLIVGMIQMIILLLYGELLFGIGVFRDPVTLVMISLVWTVAATSFGMLIAAFSRTPKQADSMTPLVTLTFAALGGCWFPLQMIELPRAVEWMCKSTPTYWAMSAFQGYFWDGLGLGSSKVLFAVAVQLGFAIVMMVIASRLFQRNFVRG
ncbi:Inner membrane transport permease YbhS [Rubripirellula amarantea]|uniref:Inner membrane transport permease YbhS n=1 Tax=Rubripirellula amarantea TaxID=2527999 RepID=A0A5C5WMQ9_9BACT|nr:ABC transporter permease [Rubripirellula amarantea]TWT51293.1 Inner membrane transport permease YbhS [Rubripirellula amarantea]